MRLMTRPRNTARQWAGVALATLLIALVVVLRLAPRARLERADFVFNNGGDVATLDPHVGSGVPEGRVARALFEGLVTRNPGALVPEPGAAERWDVSRDGLTYSFHLREGLTWSNGDPLVARNFEWSFRRILSPETASPFAALLDPIHGAREYRLGERKVWAGVGITTIDERTLEVRMQSAAPLLDILSHSAFVPVHRDSIEAFKESHPGSWRLEWLRPENLVVNGPFKIRERRVNDRLRLERNPLYHGNDSVAFDTIDVLAVQHWGTALNLYLAGDIDWLDGTIPPDLVPQLLPREDFHSNPFLGVYFYRFNVTRPPFDDVLVRRAFSWTIDRKAIVDELLGAGQRQATTFVPFGRIRTYQSPRVSPIPKPECVTLFAEAGYAGDNRKPFPPVSIHFNNTELHRNLAEFIGAGWSETFKVKTRLAPQEQRMYLDAQRNLDYDVSRSSWIGDYQDVSNFLDIWVTDGPNNRTGWSNPEYDALIARAQGAVLMHERNAHYAAAETILLRELPFAPIYFYVSQNLVSPRLGGFGANQLNDQFPGRLYWMDDSELAAARALLPAGKAPVRNPTGPRRGKYSAAQRAERGAGGLGGAGASGAPQAPAPAPEGDDA